MRPEQTVIFAQTSALKHVRRKPVRLYTQARLAHVAAASRLSIFQSITGLLDIPADIIDPDFTDFLGRKILDEDIVVSLFQSTAYPIPVGETYLVVHNGYGEFSVINPDGTYASFLVDDDDGTE